MRDTHRTIPRTQCINIPGGTVSNHDTRESCPIMLTCSFLVPAVSQTGERTDLIAVAIDRCRESRAGPLS
jgi:hypothetical protein